MKESLRRIRAVFAREFFTLAASAAMWVFLVIFLVLAGIFTFVFNNILELGQADLRPFFNSMPWLFIFVIPALGMPMWSEEKRNGTLELNLSYPCTISEMVFGKYLAGMLILFFALIFTLGTPITLYLLGEPDTSAVVCGYLGAFMAGSVFLAVTAFCSALTRSQTASFLISFLFCSVLLFTGNDIVTSFIAGNLGEQTAEWVAFFSIAPRYLAFQRGLLDTSEIAYAILATVFFLYLARSVLLFSTSGAGNIPGALGDIYTWRQMRRLAFRIIGGLYVFACLLYASQVFGYRFDFTSDKAYSLTSEASNVASSLKRDVLVTFYVSDAESGMPRELQQYAARVKWLLREFAKKSPEHIKLKFVEPRQDSIDEELARIEGVKSVKNETGDRFFFGMSFTSGARTISLPVLSTLGESTLEYDIVRSILNVTRVKKPVVGVMSVFGVLPKEPTRENPTSGTAGWYIFNKLADDFTFIEVPLDANEIPEEVDALVLIHPAGITQRGIYAIDQYIMRGGKLAAFIDPMSAYANSLVRRDTSFIDKFSSELDTLTRAWGIDVMADTVAADMNFKETLTTRDGLRTTNPMTMSVTKEGLSRENYITLNLNLIQLRYSAFFDVTGVRKDLKVEPLIYTTERSMPASIEDLPEKIFDELGSMKESGSPLIMGLYLSGRFSSAFKLPVDAASLKDGFEHLNNSKVDSSPEVFLFGDSDMLFRDALVRQMPDEFGQMTFVPVSENMALFQNVLEQLCGNGNLSNLRSRVPMTRPLKVINEAKIRAELNFSERVKTMMGRFMRTQKAYENLRKYLAANPSDIRLTDEQKELLGTYSIQEAEFKREVKEARASLRAELDAVNTKFRLVNIFIIPGCVMLLGIIWGLARHLRWRRRKA